ncbi:C-type lectin 37Db-like [Drosophila innubila]|uniref:C-type lectin 37Db-like n=1 Tax=Drosophila innubila TaxID=198719 RepID=UPI00148D64F1|nr:C-type lectin 37Db-like [Drosophila innubila]
MKIILTTILISRLILIGSSQTCKESKELDNNCGRYCFTVVKPVLEHTVQLQKQVDSQDLSQKLKTQMKFENIEQQLKILQDEVAKLKLNSVQEKLEDQKGLFEKIGSKYYYIERHQGSNWFTAVHKCHELGGHLASLQNQRELDALIPKLQPLTWIDINDLGHKGVYLSHTTGHKAPFFNWHQGEPNHSFNIERCVLLEYRAEGYNMNDQDCNVEGSFICEMYSPK